MERFLNQRDYHVEREHDNRNYCTEQEVSQGLKRVCGSLNSTSFYDAVSMPMYSQTSTDLADRLFKEFGPQVLDETL